MAESPKSGDWRNATITPGTAARMGPKNGMISNMAASNANVSAKRTCKIVKPM